MRAIVKTLMIIFAVVEVVLGLKRTVTIADRDGNKEYVPSKEDPRNVGFYSGNADDSSCNEHTKIERNMDYGNLGSDSERNYR